MDRMTITEGLAEIRTIGKRLEKKREAVGAALCRQDGLRDPMEKAGGSAKFIASERQSIGDLETRIVRIRCAVALANANTKAWVGDSERTIAEWLYWRRDVSPGQKEALSRMLGTIRATRDKVTKSGFAVVPQGGQAQAPGDLVVNVDEAALLAEIETMETTLGDLDGTLSLKNATTFIEV